MKQSKTLYKTLISEYTRRIAEMKDNLPLIEDVKEEISNAGCHSKYQ